MTDSDVHEAFSAVIQERQYAEAAGKVSRIMRARKRSPLQEAGGERSRQHGPACSDAVCKTPFVVTVTAHAHLQPQARSVQGQHLHSDC